MSYLNRDDDTICAVSTARGTGGISVVRVSGSQSLEIVRKLCSFLPESCTSHKIYYGFLREYQGDSLVDEVLVSYFAKGRSFTGEQTLEISIHGGDFLSQKIVCELQKSGARAAERGEFTYRAFMNGRIDLPQAEGVLAMIESRSQQSATLALKQLKGELSTRFSRIEDQLVWILAHLEASIDFSSEDIQYTSREELIQHGQKLQAEVRQILSTYKYGRQIKEGVDIAIVGEPNVGKSSLLNTLLGDNRALVSSRPGTTRDYIEGQLCVDGVTYFFHGYGGVKRDGR